MPNPFIWYANYYSTVYNEGRVGILHKYKIFRKVCSKFVIFFFNISLHCLIEDCKPFHLICELFFYCQQWRKNSFFFVSGRTDTVVGAAFLYYIYFCRITYSLFSCTLFLVLSLFVLFSKEVGVCCDMCMKILWRYCLPLR